MDRLDRRLLLELQIDSVAAGQLRLRDARARYRRAMDELRNGTTDDGDGTAGPDGHAVCGILDELAGAAGEQERVQVGTLVEAFGHRGYGALLLVPALLEISPIGGIPGVPTALAVTVIVFAVQIVLGRDHMWLPGFVERRCVDADGLGRAIGKMRPVAGRLDRWFHGRLEWLVRRPFTQIAAGACAALALTVPPLEIVPFASTAPMAVIALFGIALLVHDGLVMLVAFALSLVALGVVGTVLL